jgi:hypothetical protein
MLKALWCWLVGWPCTWHTNSTHAHRRAAYGVFINCEQPQVTETAHEQTCTRCGRVRTCTTVV